MFVNRKLEKIILTIFYLDLLCALNSSLCFAIYLPHIFHLIASQRICATNMILSKSVSKFEQSATKYIFE